MHQSKLAAFWEAWQSTIVGFALAWLSALYIMPVCVRLWGFAGGGTAFTLWMTALSLLRQWAVRIWHERKNGQRVPPDFRAAIEEIAAERWRQISREGFTPAHDDTLVNGELAQGAAAYCIAAGLPRDRYRDLRRNGDEAEVAKALPIFTLWPWHNGLFKPMNPRRDLIKACAMIVAEIGRIDRAARSTR